jgi:hypothetical protein
LTTEFPLTGETCRVDYGEMVMDHDYTVPGKVTYTMLDGPDGRFSATVDIDVTPIRDDVFAVAFQDEFATVVMIEDLAAGRINTYIVTKEDHQLVHHRGTLNRR